MAWASVKETNQRTEQTNEPGLSRLITRHRDGERYLNTWMQDRLQVIGTHERDRLVFRLPGGCLSCLGHLFGGRRSSCLCLCNANIPGIRDLTRM